MGRLLRGPGRARLTATRAGAVLAVVSLLLLLVGLARPGIGWLVASVAAGATAALVLARPR